MSGFLVLKQGGGLVPLSLLSGVPLPVRARALLKSSPRNARSNCPRSHLQFVPRFLGREVLRLRPVHVLALLVSLPRIHHVPVMPAHQGGELLLFRVSQSADVVTVDFPSRVVAPSFDMPAGEVIPSFSATILMYCRRRENFLTRSSLTPLISKALSFLRIP